MNLGVTRRRAGGGVALTALWLAGCASPPRATGERFSGRLSLRVDGAPDRNVSAGFELSGDAQAGELLLTTPLGTTAAQAQWLPGQAVLRQGGDERRFANLDDLTAAALGEPLPLAAMFDWLRGRPWPPAASAPRADGVAGFDQLGWRVDLSRRAEGWLDARRDTPSPGLTVRVRLDLQP